MAVNVLEAFRIYQPSVSIPPINLRQGKAALLSLRAYAYNEFYSVTVTGGGIVIVFPAKITHVVRGGHATMTINTHIRGWDTTLQARSLAVRLALHKWIDSMSSS